MTVARGDLNDSGRTSVGMMGFPRAPSQYPPIFADDIGYDAGGNARASDLESSRPTTFSARLRRDSATLRATFDMAQFRGNHWRNFVASGLGNDFSHCPPRGATSQRFKVRIFAHQAAIGQDSMIPVRVGWYWGDVGERKNMNFNRSAIDVRVKFLWNTGDAATSNRSSPVGYSQFKRWRRDFVAMLLSK